MGTDGDIWRDSHENSSEEVEQLEESSMWALTKIEKQTGSQVAIPDPQTSAQEIANGVFAQAGQNLNNVFVKSLSDWRRSDIVKWWGSEKVLRPRSEWLVYNLPSGVFSWSVEPEEQGQQVTVKEKRLLEYQWLPR